MSAEATGHDALLDVVRQVAVVTIEAQDLHEAAQRCLDVVCTAFGWPVGHLYLRDPDGGYRSSGAWSLADGSFEQLRTLTRERPLPLGVGLPAQAAQSGPVWVDDLSALPRFADDAFGLRTAIACPVVAGSGDAVGVLELLTRDRPPRDERLLTVLDTAGHLLGRVAERCTAVEQLRIGEERMRRILDTAGDAFVAMDEQGGVLDWNREAAQLFGWTREQALGRTLAELLIPEELRSAHEQGLRRFLTSGEQNIFGQRIQVTACRSDGGRVPVELLVWPLRVGDAWEFNAFLHDVTERLAAEEQLRDQAAQLEAANAELTAANALKDDFLAVTSHELRTPLTSILGYTHLLRTKWDRLTDERRRDAVAVVDAQAHRLLSLVEDLLTMARIEAGALELDAAPLRMDVAVQEAVAAAGVPATDVTVDVPADVVALGDAGAVQQMLVNYLTNAAKYGAVPLRVTVAVDGARVEVRVADRGPGVPPEFVDRLFEKFTQASPGNTRSSKGTGLGLAIVARLAAAHGGAAWYERGDPGATFAFSLPRADPSAGGGAAP